MPIGGAAINVEDVTVLRDLPIWVVHCKGDPIVPYHWSVDTVASLDAASNKTFLRLDDAAPQGVSYLKRKHILTSYDKNGRDAWTDTFCQPHIYKWLLSQKLEARTLRPDGGQLGNAQARKIGTVTRADGLGDNGCRPGA